MELRSTYRWGGGPDKTILNSALMHDKQRLTTLVVYLRSHWDTEFSIGEKARKMGLNYEEIIEYKIFDLKAFKSIILLIRKHNIDILHSRDYKTNLYALLIRKLFCRNIKIVTTAHGWVGNGLKLSFYYSIDKIVASFFDRNFILFQDMVKNFIRRPNPKTTVVIHNAIDPVQWSPDKYTPGKLRQELNISADSKIIGYVGRIMPEKDILTMIKVAQAIIGDHHINAFFVLVGESKDESYDKLLQNQIQKSALSDRFLCIGKRSELQQYYRDFDIFLMTSLQEGFPNSLLEAMAMKIPSVVPAIDGIPELIISKENGVLCQPGDVVGFVDAVLALINSPQLCKSISDTARNLIKNELSFDKRLKKMEYEYERVITQF
jgi:glycosyltransferase involved in cell wall biosynthesis